MSSKLETFLNKAIKYTPQKRFCILRATFDVEERTQTIMFFDRKTKRSDSVVLPPPALSFVVYKEQVLLQLVSSLAEWAKVHTVISK